MKRIFKLFPAALAVFALASCSEIDSIDEKTSYTASENGDLIVEVENFDNVVYTRALRDVDGMHLTFQAGDEFKVYDDELYKYDNYEYRATPTGAFYLKDDQILETPKYGLFPGQMVVRGYYDRSDHKTKAEFAIPQTIVYDVNSEVKVGTDVYYAANLPMFGLAELNGDKVKVSKLRHICGVLKIELNDAFQNATWLKLSSATKNLSGTFVAVLDASSEEARKAVKLEESTIGDLIVNPFMYIDLRGIPSRSSVIFVPLIPGIDANADGLTLEYSTDATATKGSDIAVWTDTGMKFPKETIAANKLYTAENSFPLTDMTPNKVNALLNQYVASESPINLELDNKFTIDNTVSGKTISIPALKDDVDVSITLGEKFGTVAGEGWINGSGWALTVEDADDDAPFEGTFTLDISDIHAGITTGTADVTPITIDLPNADVVLVGDYTKMLTVAGPELLSVYSAKSITFGDGATETKITAADLKIGTVKEINVAAKATITNNVIENTVAGYATPKNVKLNVAGQIVGNVNFATAYNSEIKMTASLDDPNATVVAGNVTTGGDVEIALAKEAEAISGTLSMEGGKSDLTIKQGYVSTISVNITNTGAWEGKYINVNLDEITGDGLVAFNNLTEATGQKAKFSKSKWGGKKISNSLYQDKFTSAYGATNCVFTASQLATFTSIGGNTTLNNNLDMDSKAWTGYQQKGTFEGVKVVGQESEDEYPVIENLNISKGGLFTTNLADATIKNLTFDGVNTTGLATALVGAGTVYKATTASTTINFDNVEVKGLAVTSGINAAGNKLSLTKVGGLVGANSAALNLVATTTAGSIVGYHSLGGLVGELAAGSITTDKDTKSTVAVSSDFTSTKDMDIDYARIGGLIGTVGATATATINAATTATKPTHAFSAKEYTSDISAGTGNFYTFTPINEEFIGFSNSATDPVSTLATGTLKYGTSTYMLPTKNTNNGGIGAGQKAIYWFKAGRPE